MKLLLQILSILFFVSWASAYTPPIGIPDPGFGVDDARPDRPTDWTNYVAGYYYVNLSTGNDTTATTNAGGYGTPIYPRKTIPSTLGAGTYVEVHGTTSTPSGTTLVITCNGTSATWSAGVSGPVWIVGENVANRPEILQPIQLKGTYGYLDTIYLSGNYGFIKIGSATTGYPADHMVVRNCEVVGEIGVSKGGINISGSATDATSNIVVYNSHFHHCDDQDYPTDSADVHITTVNSYCSNIWFLENEINDSSGSGTQIAASSSVYTSTHNIYYGKNTVYNTRQAGLAIKYGTDIVMSENTIHDIGDTHWSPSKGIGWQYGPLRLWILFNHIYNNRFGIRGASTDAGSWPVYVIGNVIHDNHIETLVYNDGVLIDPTNSYTEGAITVSAGDPIYVLNNTIYDSYGGINVTGPSTGAGDRVVQNNIVANITDNNHLWVGDTNYDEVLISNNIFYQDSSINSGAYRYQTGLGTVYTSLAAFASATGESVGSEDNPDFVLPENNNFAIQSSSPAKDTGVLADVYATFQSLYGIDIQKDIAGTTRPINSLWDIGAYEYNEAVAPHSRGTVLLGQ